MDTDHQAPATAGTDPSIDTARLRLRPLWPTDAERVAEILSHPDVGWMIRQIPLPYPPDEARKWLDTHADERASGHAYRFGAILEGRLIGCADIDGIEDRAGELGYWFDPACWGHGYAFEAADAVVHFAFADLGLQRITATHAHDNPRSGRLLLKLGFRETGRRAAWSNSRRQPIEQVRYVLNNRAPTMV